MACLSSGKLSKKSRSCCSRIVDNRPGTEMHVFFLAMPEMSRWAASTQVSSRVQSWYDAISVRNACDIDPSITKRLQSAPQT